MWACEGTNGSDPEQNGGRRQHGGRYCVNTWFPDLKALWMAENVVAGLHNVLHPSRRKSAGYLKVGQIYQWGDQAEVMFQSHSWPRWGTVRVKEVLRGQRDMYRT